MEVINLRLEGLKLLKPKVYTDERGFFLETYQQATYNLHGILEPFVQDNQSFSKQGCVRGMHFQSTPGQAKLVRVVSGKIWDVVVDVRPHSKTFGQWHAEILDAENHHQFYIPVGFAHGFCALMDSHVAYKVSTPYNPSTEKGFRWNDPDIKIPWPVGNPLVSLRDQESSYFEELFSKQ